MTATRHRRPATAALRRLAAYVVATALLGASGCHRPSGALKAAPSSRTGALSLPDELAGFVALPEAGGAGYVRRTYTHARTRIDVTLAQAPLPPGGFDRWVIMSRTFPQATLDAPVADANGFYQCTEGRKPSCDLLIQMRSGVHLEIRGGGTSSREDVDAISQGLPLRSFATAIPPFASAVRE